MEDQAIIILLSLLFMMVFVVMHQVNRELFLSILMTPLAYQFIKRHEYGTSNKKLSYTLFYILSFFAIGLTLKYYGVLPDLTLPGSVRDHNLGPYYRFIFWAVVIGGFFFIKAFIEYLTFYLLDLGDLVRSFISYKFLLANYCSVMLVPVIIINEFNELDLTINFNYIIIALIVVYVLGQLLYISKYDKRILNNLHYFILYLCAFEFGTYFVVYHLMLD